MIRFGTSGWRGLMGEEFTFHNVRVVVQAIANHLRHKFPDGPIAVVIGYDTRFLSERFALEAAKLLSKNGVTVFLADRDAPSQALALQIIRRKCQGGINFTASFNPPWYNGLKFNVETGAPALPEVTDRLEDEVRRLMPRFSHLPVYAPKENITRIDLQADYLAFIQDKIDFAALRAAGLRVGVDLLYGTSREYLDEVLEENGVLVEGIHGYLDPYFGGVTPSCTEDNLAELKRLVRTKKCHLGVATDADGDRFGIIDEGGAFIHQNYILAMLLDYLVAGQGLAGRRRAVHHDDPPPRPHRRALRPPPLQDEGRLQVHGRPLPQGPHHLRRGGERLHRRQGPPAREGRHLRRASSSPR